MQGSAVRLVALLALSLAAQGLGGCGGPLAERPGANTTPTNVAVTNTVGTPGFEAERQPGATAAPGAPMGNTTTQAPVPAHTDPGIDHGQTVREARERGPRVPILEYHDITYIPNDPWAMRVDQFAAEMKYLHDNGFHPISLDQLYAAMQGRASLPARPVVITFDDGYESTYTNAFPILRQYKFPAAVFMISGFIGRQGFLTGDQLVSMENSGLVLVESHTVHHINLMLLNQTQVMNELTQSKAQLTALLHHPVNYFCYPDGGYSWRDVLDVRKAGYLMATTTDQGYARLAGNPYELRRIAIHEDISLSQFAALLAPSLKITDTTTP